MSKRTVKGNATQSTNTGKPTSRHVSIVPGDFSKVMGTSRLPVTTVDTAVKTIRDHKQEIDRVIGEACKNLPDPANFKPGQRPVFEIIVSDTSGSQRSHIGTQVDSENIVTQRLIEDAQPSGGIYITRLGFNTRVYVIQPFQQLLQNDPTSQLWFTTDMEAVDDAHKQFYYELIADGDTDLNLAVITALALAKYIDFLYRKYNIMAKFVITIKTDGQHNGSMSQQHVMATFEATREFDNVYILFVAIGSPQAAQYARELGIPADAVLDVQKGPEAMIKAAQQVSEYSHQASLTNKPASQFHLVSDIDRILGEVEDQEQIQAGHQGSNVFEALDSLELDIIEDLEEDEANS
jgi:hypothetical protein